MKFRKSISGVKLREFDHPTSISVTTFCPSKWVLIDTQDGHVYGKQHASSGWVTPTAATMRDARACLAKALVSGEASKKERPTHGVIYDAEGAHLACNKEKGMASGLEYDSSNKVVTCKNCLRVLSCGVQEKLNLG